MDDQYAEDFVGPDGLEYTLRGKSRDQVRLQAQQQGFLPLQQVGPRPHPLGQVGEWAQAMAPSPGGPGAVDPSVWRAASKWSGRHPVAARALEGGISGGGMGFMLTGGNPVGAAVGGIAGGVGGAVGGAMQEATGSGLAGFVTEMLVDIATTRGLGSAIRYGGRAFNMSPEEVTTILREAGIVRSSQGRAADQIREQGLDTLDEGVPADEAVEGAREGYRVLEDMEDAAWAGAEASETAAVASGRPVAEAAEEVLHSRRASPGSVPEVVRNAPRVVDEANAGQLNAADVRMLLSDVSEEARLAGIDPTRARAARDAAQLRAPLNSVLDEIAQVGGTDVAERVRIAREQSAIKHAAAPYDATRSRVHSNIISPEKAYDEASKALRTVLGQGRSSVSDAERMQALFDLTRNPARNHAAIRRAGLDLIFGDAAKLGQGGQQTARYALTHMGKNEGVLRQVLGDEAFDVLSANLDQVAKQTKRGRTIAPIIHLATGGSPLGTAPGATAGAVLTVGGMVLDSPAATAAGAATLAGSGMDYIMRKFGPARGREIAVEAIATPGGIPALLRKYSDVTEAERALHGLIRASSAHTASALGGHE